MDTIAYIDAFNLYFGALKPNQCKWLDLETWLNLQFPKNRITAIKYFTARVKPFEGDSGPCQRQSDTWPHSRHSAGSRSSRDIIW